MVQFTSSAVRIGLGDMSSGHVIQEAVALTEADPPPPTEKEKSAVFESWYFCAEGVALLG